MAAYYFFFVRKKEIKSYNGTRKRSEGKIEGSRKIRSGIWCKNTKTEIQTKNKKGLKRKTAKITTGSPHLNIRKKKKKKNA